MFEFIPLELSFDFSWVHNLGTMPLYAIMWHFFINGGWVLFVAALVFGGYKNYLFYKNVKFFNKQTFIMLAIDIPKDNLQTPRAVENLFTALAGAHTPFAWHEQYIKGEFQLGFSLEIVSIDGFIQFLIRTPSHWRNLVEAAVYSQYPEAEITEVEDYTTEFKDMKFPHDEYNLWGTDLALCKEDVYPIKTYVEFQEVLDSEFKDPMAALLEMMSQIGPGEQLWFQILIFPTLGWEKKGMKVAEKLMGLEKPVKPGLLDKMADIPLKTIAAVGDEIVRGFDDTQRMSDDKKDDAKFNMMALPPHIQNEIDAIMKKMDKINFDTKIRFTYIGKREVFKKGLGVSGMMGAIKQFTSTGLNALKPDKNKTQALLYFKDWRTARRQNKFLFNYIGRNAGTCNGPYLMNTEELASLYHFPYIEVKSPMVKQVGARKSRAPIGLPVGGGIGLPLDEGAESENETGKTAVIDYDTDFFEDRFAVDKSRSSDKKRKKLIIKQLERDGKIEKKVKQEELLVKSEEPARNVLGSDTGGKPAEEDKNSEFEVPKIEEEKVVVEQNIENDDENNEVDTPNNLPFV